MPYVSQEAVADPQWVVAAALELSQEVLAVGGGRQEHSLAFDELEAKSLLIS